MQYIKISFILCLLYFMQLNEMKSNLSNEVEFLNKINKSVNE